MAMVEMRFRPVIFIWYLSSQFFFKFYRNDEAMISLDGILNALEHSKVWLAFFYTQSPAA